MGFIDGDLVPSSSGQSHLGIEARGETNFNMSSLSPFGHIHQLSGVFHNGFGGSGILRFAAAAMEVSIDGGKTFERLYINQAGKAKLVFFYQDSYIVVDNDLITNDVYGYPFVYDQDFNILYLYRAIALKNYAPGTTEVSPSFRASGVKEIVAINLAERPTLAVRGSGQNLGLPYAMQNALFNRLATIRYPTTANTIGVYGDNNGGSVGTVTHPTANVASGQMLNYATAAGAGSTAGIGNQNLPYCRGNISGINTGFFFSARIALPDANLDRGIIFVGLTAGTMPASVASNKPAGDVCGFQFVAAGPSATWQFFTNDSNSSATRDTFISCSGNRVFDMSIYSPPFPNNNVMHWTITDLSNNRTVRGEADTGTLPRFNTMMRSGVQINNVSAGVRNIRFQNMYCESL